MPKKLSLPVMLFGAAALIWLPSVSRAACACTLTGSFELSDEYTPSGHMTRNQSCNALYAQELSTAQSKANGFCTSLGQFGGLCYLNATPDGPCFFPDGPTAYAATKYAFQCMQCGLTGP